MATVGSAAWLRRFYGTPWNLLRSAFQDLRQPPSGNRPCLDVLRSLAVSLVLAFHLQTFCPFATRTLKTPFVRFGWSGVDLFFVLSGVLIGGQLWKEIKASGTVKVRRFILRRGFRIWPLYYFLILFLFAEHLFGYKRPYLWIDAGFLSNYYLQFHLPRPEVGGGWSLCIEEQFYLLIPILLMLATKLLPPKSLFGLGLLWLVALPVIRHLALHGIPAYDYDARRLAVYYRFQTHSDGLAIGLLIAWLLTWKPEFLAKSRIFDGALLLLFCFSFSLWYRLGMTMLYSAVAVAYGALTLFLLRVRMPSLFRSNVFYVISRLSYGIYLIHPGLLKHAMPYHVRLFGQRFPSFFLAFFFWGAATLGLSFVTFSFVELPFLKLRGRLLAKQPSKVSVPLPGMAVSSPSAD